MKSSKPVPADPRPRSAVSHGVGLAGFVGLAAWIAVARYYGMDGRYSAMTAVLSCGLCMVLWSLFVDKVHKRPSTGIDWSNPKPLRETIDISLVKLAGLWATWGIIAILYGIGRWYWQGQYIFAMEIFEMAAPFVFLLSVPYVVWLDRYLVEPRDGAWHMGQLLVGQVEPDRAELANHARSWAVKAFFLAFMISIVPGGFGEFIRADFSQVWTNPVLVANWLIIFMFIMDVHFATVGYMLTMKPLDAHIRTANPYMAGWVAALICYPPFILMEPGGPLDYHIDTADWAYWFQGYPILLWIWGGILVVLTFIYAWATIAFGLRFSNLTHRGILTHGPYSWTKHPAYLSKNAYWWLATMPFFTVGWNGVDMIRNLAILIGVSAVYFWRAKTEEKHLMADPAYREYAEWMARNAPIPRLIGWITGRRPAPRDDAPETVPAE